MLSEIFRYEQHLSTKRYLINHKLMRPKNGCSFFPCPFSAYYPSSTHHFRFFVFSFLCRHHHVILPLLPLLLTIIVSVVLVLTFFFPFNFCIKFFVFLFCLSLFSVFFIFPSVAFFSSFFRHFGTRRSLRTREPSNMGFFWTPSHAQTY